MDVSQRAQHGLSEGLEFVKTDINVFLTTFKRHINIYCYFKI